MTAARSIIPSLGPHDHVAGPADGPLELVMYGDFQCPYCAASQSILRRVRERLHGRLRFAFRHMPLPEVHPLPQQAGEASEAAAAQGAFWPMHDRLYGARGRLGLDDLVAHAAALGLAGRGPGSPSGRDGRDDGPEAFKAPHTRGRAPCQPSLS